VYETGSVDIGMGEFLPFIMMELVQGTSLDEIHAFTYAGSIDIGRQICDALKYIHDQGFVYRDLKPGNVILEKRGFHYFVKLLDFGLARPRGEAYLPTESNLAGSAFYLAPELISGQPADVSSDLYALGVTLYEMLTGRVPFSNFNEQNILSQHLEEPVAPPSHSRNDMPPALESIILRLLEKNPKDRFASAQDVNHALEHAAIAFRSAASGNLPHTSNNISGYETEITQVIQLLEASPLVTLLNEDDALVLALAVAAQLSDQLIDGAWLVKMESVSDPMIVLQTVASILGVHENPNRPLTVSLIESLREKNLLLLLDRCDLFPGACVQLIETILSACPDVHILAVSRQPLNIPADKCYGQVDKTSN
jgi:serine/threonine protein kinase